MALDSKDLQIIYHLKHNSRMSLSDLGKKLEMTASAINYRLNKLIENKVIKQFSIVVDHSILTPNFQKYMIKAKIKPNYIQEFYQILDNTNYMDRIIEIASTDNFMGISYPLSNKQFKDLMMKFKNENIEKYDITPIVDEFSTYKDKVTGENIQNIYCPLCQKSISGQQGIITKIQDQVFSFCCNQCLDEFKHNYLEISEAS